MILRNFVISPFDTVSNILIRIASMFNSIPNYIYIRDVVLDIQALRKQRVLDGVETIDLLSIIRDTPDIRRFAGVLANVIGFFPDLNLVNDILTPWLYFHLTDVPEDQLELIIFSTVGTVNKALKTKVELSLPNFEVTKRASMKLLESRISENHRLAQAINSMSTNVPEAVYTEFSIEKIKYAIEISSSDSTINEIFNSIVLTPEIPFACVNGYYKILKDFIPDPAWTTCEPNTIKIKLAKDGKEYEDILFVIDKGVFNIILNADVEKQSKDILVKKVLDIIGSSKPSIMAEKSISLKGVFYIPNQPLNKYVFSDMVMNDTVFSQLVIDEVGKATKEKSSMYVYYNTGQYMMSTVITPKFLDRFDPTMKGQSIDLFPEGSPYIRVRVTGRDTDSIKDFQQTLAKLITIYREKYNTVVDFYRKYIPDFPVIVEKVVKKKQKQQFAVTGGARRCQNPPLIINREDSGKYRDTMTFPLTGEGQVYTCDIKERGIYKHIGLQYRKDINEFVPCCFKIDQKAKPGSNYNKYLKFVETGVKAQEKTSTKQQQRLIKTKKFVSNGTFGDLYYPEPSKFFDTVNPTERYLRLGVNRSRTSLLNCVMEVFREEGTPAITVQNVRDKLEQLVGNPGLVSICRQELPERSPEDIRQILLSPDTYVDPRLYTRIFEVAFGCRIFTFSENGLEIPRHLKNYLSYDHPYDKIILIMEHMGSESDNAQYPQCEIIVHNALYSFEKTDRVSIALDSIFKNMTRSYLMGDMVSEYVMDLEGIVGQTIDLYGKVNSLSVSHPMGNFLVYTDVPLPPLAVPENVTATYLPSSDDMLKLFHNFRYVVRENDNVTRCIEVKLINTYLIPIQPITVPVKAPRVVRDIVVPEPNSESKLKKFNMLRKLARYITEYALYAYSKFINDGNLPLSIDSLEAFASTISINPSVVYGMISKKFSTSESIMQGGRLVVGSREIARRVVYAIRLEMFKNPTNLLGYYRRVNIDAYIKDISDFKDVPGQVILYGMESMMKYIQELRRSYRFNYDIGFTGPLPFFYKNPLLENRVFIAQNDNTLELSKSRIGNWQQHGVNTPFPENPVNVSEYSYKSDTEIQIVNNPDTRDAILGYRVKKTPAYTALMALKPFRV